MISLIKKLTKLGWELYETYIVKRGKQYLFITFITFLLTIFISRCIVMWIEAGRPFLNFFRFSDYHIHHFYLGILLVILSNWFLLFWGKKRYIEKIKSSSSILFGVGFGLIIDESGLLLTMELDIKGNYWAPHSYYFMGILSAVFLFSILFPQRHKE